MPHFPEFLSAYPDIRIDAMLTDATVDLIETGTEVAVRIGALSNSTFIAKRLAPHWRTVVASPAYLESRPPIAAPNDLSRHDCLLFTLLPNDTWYFTHHDRPRAGQIEIRVNARLRINDSEALLGAALGRARRQRGHQMAQQPWLPDSQGQNLWRRQHLQDTHQHNLYG
jgi:DNA-binding transcriptional LysR family regulator